MACSVGLQLAYVGDVLKSLAETDTNLRNFAGQYAPHVHDHSSLYLETMELSLLVDQIGQMQQVQQ